ncbi:Nucleolar complex-associated protein 3 [Pleurotus pulmonarius]
MAARKRPGAASKAAPVHKKRKLTSKSDAQLTTTASKKQNTKGKAKQKEKAPERLLIPIPTQDDDEDTDVPNDDMGVLDEYGDAVMFLDRLDYKGIARSKQETERLQQLNKPIRRTNVQDDLPSLDSDSGEEDDDWTSGAEDPVSSSDEEHIHGDESLDEDSDSDAEMPYESKPRQLPDAWREEKKDEVESLPIKLADGRIQKTGNKKLQTPKDDSDESDASSIVNEPEPPRRDDIATGSRFGRVAVVDIISTKSRKARIQGAKEQIASLCQEIISDPENSLGLLRRLHTFSLASISSITHPEPVANDHIIRKLAILSQLAVFKDIIPGYRIRSLTDKEKAEKVGQMVARTREWEQGLVGVYQTYLQSLETELKARNDLSAVALQCMCALLVDVTHFNFRVNIMNSVVATLSKKGWDETSDLCLNTLVKVFRNDLTGQPSLEIVRLLNRMVKERHFNVHPNVLTCLLSLRLKTELGVRASDSKANPNEPPPKRKKDKKEQPHLSKKAKKVLKEKKEIEREFREAEAEVDKEERAITQTETLKLLFVLYFRILKNDRPTPLLPSALRGIAKFAHLVNIDFFKDLMQVLKNLILRDHGEESFGVPDPSSARVDFHNIQHRLLCIITAFELLSGQGEALNLDLSDFVSCLYAQILPMSLIPEIESSTRTPAKPNPHHQRTPSNKLSTEASLSDLLFHALSIVFFNGKTASGSPPPPWRSAAFAKRLLSAALHWPSHSALRALEFTQRLLAKDPKLEALLSTEDRAFDGVYRPDVDDPQLCNPFGTAFWELNLLATFHGDAKVREEAKKLMLDSQA